MDESPMVVKFQNRNGISGQRHIASISGAVAAQNAARLCRRGWAYLIPCLYELGALARSPGFYAWLGLKHKKGQKKLPSHQLINCEMYPDNFYFSET